VVRLVDDYEGRIDRVTIENQRMPMVSARPVLLRSPYSTLWCCPMSVLRGGYYQVPSPLVTLRSSRTVLPTPVSGSASTCIVPGKPPRAMWSAAMLLGLYRIWGGVCPCKSQAHTPRRMEPRRAQASFWARGPLTLERNPISLTHIRRV
jgi:hypothetical protein